MPYQNRPSDEIHIKIIFLFPISFSTFKNIFFIFTHLAMSQLQI